MKGLRVSVNFATGERAGGLDPRDRRTRCNPQWQGDDHEIRVVLDESVLDDLDTSDAGVEILDDEAAVDRAVGELGDGDYAIQDTTLVVEHLRQRGKSLDDYVDQDGNVLQGAELARALAADNVTGLDMPTPRPGARDVGGGPRPRG